MVEIRQPFNPDLTLLPAMIFSIALHCVIASVLLLCLKGNSRTTIAPSVITVDIRTLETQSAAKEKTCRQPGPKVVERQKPVMPQPLRTTQEPVRTHTEPPAPEPLHPRYPDSAADTLQAAVPAPMNGVAHAKTISFPEGSVGLPKPAGISSAGGVSTPRQGETGDAGMDTAYLASLRMLIEEHKEYPLIARKGHIEGAVHVSCMIRRNGEIMEASVVRSSGYGILDKAAKRAVTSTGRFPVIPPNIKGETYRFIAPITFRLTDD